MAVNSSSSPVGIATLHEWLAGIVADPDPISVADAAAAVGALLALEPRASDPDHVLGAALRPATDMAVPTDACCRAAYSAGALAAVAEVLAGNGDARRVVTHRSHWVDRPLEERIVDTLAHHGPMRRAELIRKVGAPPSTVADNLTRLRHRGMVQLVPTGPDTNEPTGPRAVIYTLTSAGTAASRR